MSDAAAQPAPPLTVNIQYIKDLSFEVPNAPAIYATLRSQPAVAINLDVQATRLQEGQDVFEVVLQVRAEATEAPQAANGADPSAAPGAGAPSPDARTVFIAEMAYAGVFTLAGIPAEAVEQVLLIECPRLLFPFARNILSDITRDGGFPPVLLQPIDFVALWQNNRAQQQPIARA